MLSRQIKIFLKSKSDSAAQKLQKKYIIFSCRSEAKLAHFTYRPF